MLKTCLAICLCLGLTACGYHVSGHGSSLPATIKTIAVPAFLNETSRFKIEQSLTTAVARELLQRTSYQVQSQEESSDAVLRGVVVSFYTIPLIFDSVTGRATAVSVNVLVKVTLTDRKTKKVLYQNQNFLYSERYEISRDAAGYFDESAASIDRLSRTLAGSLVSAILEGF